MISSSHATILSQRILSSSASHTLRHHKQTGFTSQLWKTKNAIRVFATSNPLRELMDLSGFTEKQLTVREAVSQVCSQFPSSYWRECDQEERDPKEFHAALAKDGWLGIALPEELGGSGLGMSIYNYHSTQT